MGDMAKDYRVFSRVVTPVEQEYMVRRKLPVRHEDFVEVGFSRDFNAPPGLLPGGSVCNLAVNLAPNIREEFTYTATEGQGYIQNRKTWFAGTNKGN